MVDPLHVGAAGRPPAAARGRDMTGAILGAGCAAANCAAAAPGMAEPGAPVLLRRLRVEFANDGLPRVASLPPAGPCRALRGRGRLGRGSA